MTTSHMDHDVALPHAGLLAYFHHPTASTQEHNAKSSPPPYDRRTSYEARQSSTTYGKEGDEESGIGFWGERSEKEKQTTHLDLVKRGYYGIYAFCCFWFAVSICILGAFGAFFILDLALTQLGMGTGMATWIVHRNVGRGVENYEVSPLTPFYSFE